MIQLDSFWKNCVLIVMALALSAEVSLAAVSCEAALKGSTPPPIVVHNDSFRWLEESSSLRTRWLLQQQRQAKQFFSQLSSRKFWHDFFEAAMDRKNVIGQAQLAKGETLTLVDYGLSKPTELIWRTRQSERVLISSDEFGRNGTAGITKFWLSPDKDFVLVPVAQRGSLDEHQVQIIDMKTGQRREIVQSIDSSAPVWVSRREFVYKRQFGRETVGLKHRLGEPETQDVFYRDLSRHYNNGEKSLVVRFLQKGAEMRGLEEQRWVPLPVQPQRILATFPTEVYFEVKNTEGFAEIFRATGTFSRTAVRLKSMEKIKSAEEAVLNQVAFGPSGSGFARADLMVAHYSMGEKSWLSVLEAPSGVRKQRIELPACCSVKGIRVQDSDRLGVFLESQVKRSQEFVFDLKSRRFIGGDPSKKMLIDEKGAHFVNEIVRVKSRDGAAVPVRLTYKKGLVKNGRNPAYIEGYGGFGVSAYFYASYKNDIHQFLLDGGIYVTPALRGGGELGPSWHAQGQKELKQNVFNDLYATAEYLHREGYSKPQKTAALGGSNGGLLMGAAITQRPDLFALVIPANGVLDVLRKEHFNPHFDLGWSSEYGNSNRAWDWPTLAAYSPVNNVRPREYPTVLIINGRNDSRVHSAHSFKFAQALQESQTGTAPIVLSTLKDAGHWVTRPFLQDRIAQVAKMQIWSTIYQVLGLSKE